MGLRGEALAGTGMRIGQSRGLGDRPGLLVGIGLLGLLVALIAGVGLGSVAVAPGDTVAILAHRLLGLDLARTWSDASETIVMELRLPRVLTAMLVGSALAVAGATYQGLLRNPLADPYVLRDRVGRRARGRHRGDHPGAVRRARVRAASTASPASRARVDLHRLPAVADQRSRAADQPAVDGLRGRFAGGRSGDGDVPVRAALRQIFIYLLGSFDTASWSRPAGHCPSWSSAASRSCCAPDR
jgi:hypothetical protein